MSNPKIEAIEVLVDSREPASTLEKVLKICPLAKRVYLDVGDIGYKNVAIELKSWSDFVTALVSKKDDRYRRQLYNFLINQEIEGFYIIYGDWHEINQFSHINMRAVLGAIASIQARYGMRLSVVPNKDYAIYMSLKIIEKTYNRKDVRPHTYRVGSDERAIDGLVAIGERVGTEDARRLLEAFGDFKKVVNATEEEMMKIKHIGKTKAQNLIKVIEYDFRSKQEFEEAIDEEIEIIDIENDKVLEKISEDFDIEHYKEVVQDAIQRYRNEKNKPCPFDNLNNALKKISEDQLKLVLRDLEMESKIYMSEDNKYETFD